ncbi:MAG: hypothetical protein KC931_27900, partial [Candidatus Omnitrophica bacterium]|nr:hypothetical protein [Candidatus Omnitrophota bacterium]
SFPIDNALNRPGPAAVVRDPNIQVARPEDIAIPNRYQSVIPQLEGRTLRLVGFADSPPWSSDGQQ